MDRWEVARVLREIGLLLELTEDNPFKSRAYYNGARALELLPEDLEILVQEGRLEEIKGIGRALAAKIAEFVTTGKLTYYEELKAAIPGGVLEMLAVPGLGPKKARVLYEKLGVSSLRELEYACRENRLVELPGFGGKTQGKVMTAIEYLKSFQGQHYYAEALAHGLELLELLKKQPAVARASLAGSIRRAKEVVKNIDLVAAGEGTGQIISYFTHLPRVREVLEEGATGAAVRLDNGMEAVLHVVEPQSFAFSLHNFTGSVEYVAAIRRLARERGLRLEEYGLLQGEELLPCPSEEELFQALELHFIPPELRENNGEIEAALQGPLPVLLEVSDIKGVFHVHTSYSDGTNTLEEMVAEAARQGFAYLGISDHSQTASYAGGLKIGDVKRQQEEIEKLRHKYPQIRIYSGIESDIKADGSLDYPDDILAGFDFIVASVHSHFRMTEDDMTRRMVRAMSHPAVTMLGHPTGRILLAREGYKVRMEELLQTAKEKGVIIELNASPARLDLDWRHLKKAKEMGILLSISPDAHRVEELGDIRYGVAVARKGWLTRDDVFNCFDVDRVQEYLDKRKQQ